MRFAKKLLVSALLATSLGANAATTMDFSTEYPDKSIHAQGDAYFIDQVDQLTQGEVKITLHTSGALGFTSADNFYAVADGAVQIADSLAGTLGGNDPLFLISSLPFVASNIDDAKRLYEISRPYYEKIFADNNQVFLYASPWPASGIWSKHVVNSAAELKDLKIRTYDKNGTLVLREAQAAPVMLSWADVVPQLSTGGIDAVLTSAEAGANGSFWEHLGFFSGIQYAVPLNVVAMNKDAFDDLSDEEQAQILAAAKKTDEHNWEVVRTRTAENYKTLAENKVSVTDPIDPAFATFLKQAAQPAIDAWLKDAGEEGQEILNKFNAKP